MQTFVAPQGWFPSALLHVKVMDARQGDRGTVCKRVGEARPPSRSAMTVRFRIKIIKTNLCIIIRSKLKPLIVSNDV